MTCRSERYAERMILAETVTKLYGISGLRVSQKHDVPSQEVCRKYDFSGDGHQFVWDF